MLIKHAMIDFLPGKKTPSLYFIFGQELFQINNLAEAVISAWYDQNDRDVDKKVFPINDSPDWCLLEQEANSYSLFSNTVLIDVRYDKKTLEAAGKNFIEQYLQNSNSRCLIIIRAPNIPLKQVQSFANHQAIHVIQCISPNGASIKQWMVTRLQKITSQYDKQIPAMIYQYTEGNLFAAAQVLDKLALLVEPDEALTLAEVESQLNNQTAYPLFDLADSCLNGDMAKALQLLRQACNSKTEPTLILWLLAQEIRILMQLSDSTTQTQSFMDKARQLKIWSQRIMLYQKAIKRYNTTTLVLLLTFCKKLDLQIKTSQNQQIWQSFELIALSLCTGKEVACLA